MFALGALALAVFSLTALSVLVTPPAWLSARRLPLPSTSRAGRIFATQLALTAGATLPLALGLERLVPQQFAYRDLIARTVAVHLAAGLAAVATYILWRRGTPTEAFPLWTCAALHFMCRLVLEADLVQVAPQMTVWVDLLSMELWILLLASRSPARPRPVAVAGLLLASITLATLLVGAGRDEAAVTGLQKHYWSSAFIVAAAQGWLDLDGDGFSAALGGSDCDDGDPRVSPTALEVVGNRIDDNCMGGDLSTYAIPRPASRPDDSVQRSLILITVDALRVDVAMGPEAARAMPNLTRFGRQAARFTRAYAHAPYTSYSLLSLTYGQHPMNLMVAHQRLGRGLNMAALLRSAQFQTLAIATIFGQDDTFLYDHFEHVDRSIVPKTKDYRGIESPTTTDLAIASYDRLAANGRPFFLWVHYMDPHAEYVPRPGSPFQGDDLPARYRQEVWATDRDLGRLLSHLAERGFHGQGITVITADHGEKITSSGRHGHGYWLHEDVLRVPLFVRAQGVEPGEFTPRVRHIDVFPTVLDLAAGIVADTPGKHLGPIWQGTDRADRDVVAVAEERVLKRAILSGPWKLAMNVSLGTRRLTRPSSIGVGLAGESPDEIAHRGALANQLQDRMGALWDMSMNSAILQHR